MKKKGNPFYDYSYDEIDLIKDLENKGNFIQALMIENTSVEEFSLLPGEDAANLPPELVSRIHL